MPAHHRASRWFLPVLFAVFLASPPLEAGPIPRLAVSLPPGVPPGDILRTLQSCGTRDALVVLPPVTARIGGAGDAGAAAAPIPPSGIGSGAAPSTGEQTWPAGRVYQHVVLEIGDVPGAGRERETVVERQVSEILGRLGVDRPWVAGLVVETTGTNASGELLQFTLATLMVKAKGAKPGLEIALYFSGGEVARLVAYADSLAIPGSALGSVGESAIQTAAAGKPIMLRTSPMRSDDATGAATAFLDLLMVPGAAIATTVWVEVPSLAALRGLCTSAQFVSRSLGDDFEMTSPERAPSAVLIDGRPASPAVAFVGSRTADVAVLLKPGGSRETPRPLSLVAASGSAPQVTCHDALDGRSLGARVAGAPAPGCRVDADYVLLVARIATSNDRLFEAVKVTGRASIRVEEIIARWQAARESERQLLDNYSVPCFVTLHFEATSLAATFDVALELEQFVDRSGTQDWVQTGFRVNGVRLKKGQEFPLPQLEPEKVVTKPLDLRMDEKYLYELLGTDTVNGRVVFVVGIKPVQATETLYSGKVWIDGVDFRQARLRLEQRDGRNNVASHVETQEFERIKDGQGREFTLVRSINAEDAVNLAGRSITLEKRYRFGEYTINSSGFAARLAAVRATDDPMFRDTEEGLRALRMRNGQRVVEPMGGKRIWAMLGGVLYDGAYSFPIPLAGISWVDFDWRKTGTQFSAFFAGPIFVGNLSRQVNKNFRWGVDLSIIALPNMYYDYAGNKELTGQQIRNFQQFVGGLANWQVTPALDLSTQADLYYDIYQATGDTDPRYRPPASGFTADFYGEAKFVKKSFSAIGTVEHGRRIGWQSFGYDNAPAVSFPNWTRYSLELSQHVFVGKLTRGGVSAGYFGGHDLDRFSQYSPSFLERPTMHGIPSGVDSFDSVASLGGYYGFNVMDLAKLEGSYTHAWTRNRFEGNALRQFDGLDLSIGMAGPFGTFVQGSVSFAIRGNLERYRSRWGTYLIFLKPLKKR